jgi:hypothetical protein
VIATDPVRFKPTICPSIAEEVAFGVALVNFHFHHRIQNSTFAVGSNDWIFAALFVGAHFALRRDSKHVPRNR